MHVLLRTDSSLLYPPHHRNFRDKVFYSSLVLFLPEEPRRCDLDLLDCNGITLEGRAADDAERSLANDALFPFHELDCVVIELLGGDLCEGWKKG